MGRIVAVADAYDAKKSNRSYRNILPQHKMREYDKKSSGTQFDPEFADAMFRNINEKSYMLRE